MGVNFNFFNSVSKSAFFFLANLTTLWCCDRFTQDDHDSTVHQVEKDCQIIFPISFASPGFTNYSLLRHSRIKFDSVLLNQWGVQTLFSAQFNASWSAYNPQSKGSVPKWPTPTIAGFPAKMISFGYSWKMLWVRKIDASTCHRTSLLPWGQRLPNLRISSSPFTTLAAKRTVDMLRLAAGGTSHSPARSPIEQSHDHFLRPETSETTSNWQVLHWGEGRFSVQRIRVRQQPATTNNSGNIQSIMYKCITIDDRLANKSVPASHREPCSTRYQVAHDSSLWFMAVLYNDSPFNNQTTTAGTAYIAWSMGSMVSLLWQELAPRDDTHMGRKRVVTRIDCSPKENTDKDQSVDVRSMGLFLDGVPAYTQHLHFPHGVAMNSPLYKPLPQPARGTIVHLVVEKRYGLLYNWTLVDPVLPAIDGA